MQYLTGEELVKWMDKESKIISAVEMELVKEAAQKK